MDTNLFLHYFRDHTLEEGRVYIQEHIAELTDHKFIGELLEEEALRILYTPFVSLKLAELLIFFGEYVSHLPSHALGLKCKGDALMMIGHHQAALECSDAAGEEFLCLGDEGNWARTRIGWTYSAAHLGRAEEALLEAKRARDVFIRLGALYWALAIDHNTGLIYVYLGRYQDALELYENMRAVYPTLTDQNESAIKQRIALAEMNQAYNLAWLGNFEEAYHLQQQALNHFISLGETDLIVNAEVNLADLAYAQGYYGSALRRYYQARDIFIQNDLDDPALLAEAVALYRQFNIPLSLGKALPEYATTLATSGRLEEALTTLEEAWTILDEGKFDSYASATKLRQAELFLTKGDIGEAYHQACLLRNYFDDKGMGSYSVRASLVVVGALIEKSKQARSQQMEGQQDAFLQEALLLCKQVVSQARQYNLQEEAYKSHYLLGRLYVLQGSPGKAARHYGVAIARIERILNDLVYDLSPAFLQSTWAVYEDMISLCLQHAQAERAFTYLEQARSMALRQYLNKSKTIATATLERDEHTSLATVHQHNATLLRTRYELRDEQEQYRYYSLLLADSYSLASAMVDRSVIEQALKQHEDKISELLECLYLYESNASLISSKRTRNTANVKQVDIAQLRQFLSPEQVLLTYFLYQGRLVIFAATAERLMTQELPDGMEQLERLLPLLHAHLDPKGWTDVQNPPENIVRRLLNKLYNLLVKPIAEFLSSRTRQITIVPYGPLHKLPFHALYDGSHYLVENFQVHYLPASSILMHLQTRARERALHSDSTEIASQPPLVLGFTENEYLQRIHDEAQTIASLLNGRCYLDRDATIEKLIEQAPGSPIIHLATHGQSRLDAPNFSYIRLADGPLNAIDAFSMDLKACELLTLSGCETGLALSGGGDEQLGLGRAFLAAGATSLVMSLWPVEDNATNELMRLFYQNLLRGESKGQALRVAQRQLMESKSYAHPYFWAAFRLVGNVGPLTFRHTTNSTSAQITQPLKKELQRVSKVSM
ncbi:MAG: CHAT domain-containing protein [Chloroflexi bacterium]|nr:MAG: CHAT domain-containing protein [Chloroflexota bacterium]